MLSAILSKKACAECKFCCSFRRKSLWETPLFTENEMQKLSQKFPAAKFRRIKMAEQTDENIYTIDLCSAYKTDDSEEEAPCPFLDTHSGCMLSKEDKPFDCSIWPLRAMIKEGKTILALTPSCKEINKLTTDEVKAFVNSSGLKKLILETAEKNPSMIKDWKENFIDLS